MLSAVVALKNVIYEQTSSVVA